MSKILCIIVLGLFMLSNVQAQLTYKVSENLNVTQLKIDLDAIPKRTWKLVIHTNKSKEENYQLMGETILDEDYMIEKAIRDFYIITTFPQGRKKMGRNYILNLVGRDSTIVLTGLIIDPDLDDVVALPDYSRIENRGMNGSPLKECFNEMVRIARKMANDGEIEYMSE